MRQDNILKTYIEASIIHGKATNEGKHREANKQYSKLSKIYKTLKNDSVLAESILTELLNHENLFVKAWAAAHALTLDINVKLAESILLDISCMDDIGILQLDAEMTLKQWKDGNLKF